MVQVESFCSLHHDHAKPAWVLSYMVQHVTCNNGAPCMIAFMETRLGLPDGFGIGFQNRSSEALFEAP